MEEDIREIFQQYPWAMEATLNDILDMDQERAKMLLEQINIIRRKWGLEDIEQNLTAATDNLREYFQEQLQKTSDTIQTTVTNIERDSDPITATAELMTLAGKATGKGAKGLGKLAKDIPVIGKLAEKSGGLLGNIAELGTGFAAAVSMIAKEQEKAARLFIDYGLQVSKQSQLTDIRGSLADVGMSMAELQPILQANKAMFAKVGTDSYTGAKTFVDMAREVEAGVGDTGDFGFNVQELTTRLAEEAQLLYGVNQIDTLNAHQQKRIKENFEKSSAMTTFMAEATGEQRSALLKMRQEANENIDFRQAIIMNSNHITEQLGEQALNNIRESRETIAMLFQSFAPGLAAGVDQTLIDGIRDIQLNQTVMDNISPELAETVALLGADAQNSFYKLMNDSIQGKMTGDETIMAFKKFADEIIQSETLKGNANSPMIDAVNNLKAQIMSMPESFQNLTAESLKKGIETAKAKTEAADDPIDAMDAVRKGFRNAMHTITPGFETTATFVDAFTDSVNFVGKIFDFIGIGYKNPKAEMADRNKERLEEVKDYDDDINGIKNRIADLKQRVANPAWWEDPERMKSTIRAYESQLREKVEERDHLANTAITKKGQDYKDILKDFRSKKASDAKKSLLADENALEEHLEDMVKNGAFVKMFGQIYRTQEEISNSKLKASLKRKLAKRLRMRERKIEKIRQQRAREEEKIKKQDPVVTKSVDGTPLKMSDLLKQLYNYQKLEKEAQANITSFKATAGPQKFMGYDAIGEEIYGYEDAEKQKQYKELQKKSFEAQRQRIKARKAVTEGYAGIKQPTERLNNREQGIKRLEDYEKKINALRDVFGVDISKFETNSTSNFIGVGGKKYSRSIIGAYDQLAANRAEQDLQNVPQLIQQEQRTDRLNTLTEKHNRLKQEIQELEDDQDGFFSGMFFGDDDQKKLDELRKEELKLMQEINNDLQSTNIKETADG